MIGHFKTRCTLSHTLATMIIHALLLHTPPPKCVHSEKLRQLKRRKTNRDEWHKTVVELLPVHSDMHSREISKISSPAICAPMYPKMRFWRGSMVSSQASCTPTTICTEMFLLRDVRQRHIDTVLLHVARHKHTDNVHQKTRSPNLAKRVPHSTISSESHFFILLRPYVSCSVKVDLSPICASRGKAWHLAPALRKDSDISNTDIFKHSSLATDLVALSPRSKCFQTPPKHQIVRE